MTIELVPVIEVTYSNNEVSRPSVYPWWENSEIWDAYHAECYRKAGFTDKLKPYLSGSYLFNLSNIPSDNLTKVVIEHTQKMRDGEYERQEISCLYGGYVLQVDGEDKYFPQCCGDLSDLIYWERIAKGTKSYCEGHPAPQISFENNNAILDFSVREYDEYFQPPPPEIILSIDRSELQKAVEKVRTELLYFEQRLQKINEDEKLEIDNIGGLLIWDNSNYN